MHSLPVALTYKNAVEAVPEIVVVVLTGIYVPKETLLKKQTRKSKGKRSEGPEKNP